MTKRRLPQRVRWIRASPLHFWHLFGTEMARISKCGALVIKERDLEELRGAARKGRLCNRCLAIRKSEAQR